MTKFTSATPYIACFLIARRGKRIALIKRKNTGWMDGMYALPAGKVEVNETYQQAVIREAREEVGIHVLTENLRFVHICHRLDADTEWVDVFFEITSWQGEPINNEPNKSEEVRWFDEDSLPENTIPVLRFCIDKIKQKEAYSEYGW